MKVGEQHAHPPFPCHGEPYAADARVSSESLTLTPEAGEILSIILEQLADFPHPQKRALLLSGDLGVDKSRLLHYLEGLLANPEHPSWSSLIQYLSLSGDLRPKAPIRTLFVQIPPDPHGDLGAFLLDGFHQDASNGSLLSPDAEIAVEEFSVRMRQASACMAEQSLGMVVLENVTERIGQLSDSDKLQRELRLYWILAEILSQRGILTILPGRGMHLNPEEQHSSMLAVGEEPHRNHSWIEFEHPSSFMLPENIPAQEEEFHERLQLLIYDWIQAEIPLWQPERGPRYRRDSQALVAASPEGGKAPSGLVYFKSVFDPCWSDEDLARLHGTVYPWILMILSPCERFYEFETRLKEIASCLPMLLIWRPDNPSKMELENLRNLPLAASDRTAEGESAVKARMLLTDLYVGRGRFIGASGHRTIGSELQGRSISLYLSTCLGRLPLERADAALTGALPSPAEAAGHGRILHWAALLAGRPELRESSVAYAQEKLAEWWKNSVEGLSGRLPELPEAFRTIRFWGEVKAVQGPSLALESVFRSLNSGVFSFFEAVDHVGRNFAWQEERLLKWKQGLERLGALIIWLPTFVHAQEYLKAAFPLNREKPDRLRESLLQFIGEPHRFLEADARKEFDQRFLEFKKSYMDSYSLLHEEALHVIGDLKKDTMKIDPVSLRNLDLLSGLQYTNKSYLNRVKLLAKWIQRNQCNLPLRQILERYPRCYCNFNPCNNQQPAGPAAQINEIIQDGIEYFRTVLRRCGHLIMAELKTQPVEGSCLQQITAALGDGPMIPMKPQCIKELNRIIGKHPHEFLIEIRKGNKPVRR